MCALVLTLWCTEKALWGTFKPGEGSIRCLGLNVFSKVAIYTLDIEVGVGADEELIRGFDTFWELDLAKVKTDVPQNAGACQEVQLELGGAKDRPTIIFCASLLLAATLPG